MFSKKDYYHRLSKYLAYSGISSRRQSESLITSGQISVNGIVVTSVSQKVSSKVERFIDFQFESNNEKR